MICDTSGYDIYNIIYGVVKCLKFLAVTSKHSFSYKSNKKS